MPSERLKRSRSTVKIDFCEKSSKDDTYQCLLCPCVLNCKSTAYRHLNEAHAQRIEEEIGRTKLQKAPPPAATHSAATADSAQADALLASPSPQLASPHCPPASSSPPCAGAILAQLTQPPEAHVSAPSSPAARMSDSEATEHDPAEPTSLAHESIAQAQRWAIDEETDVEGLFLMGLGGEDDEIQSNSLDGRDGE